MTRTAYDAEQRHWNSLPQCCYCGDACEPHDCVRCDHCEKTVCVDHTAKALNGDVICLNCKAEQLQCIRAMATDAHAAELFLGDVA